LPRSDLPGAWGIPARPPTAAMLAHPERVLRYGLFLRALWAVRIGAVVAIVLLLYLAHLVVL
jgi:hypothetical protein